MKSLTAVLLLFFISSQQHKVASFVHIRISFPASTNIAFPSSGSFYKYCRPKASASDDMTWDPKSGPKLDFNEDYYSVLEVNPSADFKALKKAYYNMVFKYHPDNRKTDSAAIKKLCNQQMMVINGAYRILKEPETRKIYDLQRNKGIYGNKAKIPRNGTGGVSSSSTSTAPTQKTANRRTYSTDDNDVDSMGWRTSKTTER